MSGIKITDMKNIIIFGIITCIFISYATTTFAGNNYPPNGKKYEVAGKVIYVDKSCIDNVSWREMLWSFENRPEISIDAQ